MKTFTLIGTVTDMWKSEIYFLAILIAVFSGIWPYVKLILLIICWCTDAKRISYKTRERILIIIDSLGKWSMLDTYVMVMMIVAFRF